MADLHDMVVVGAGWHGLAAAKAYIELHPAEDIVILEAENSIGGTWSHDRLYPGLKSNNLHGTYEHPDFPMTPEVYKIKSNAEHIPGTTLHRYLTDFAKHFGIFSRTRFNTKVNSIEPLTDASSGWKIDVTTDGAPGVLRTRKVIVATGLTSSPNFPQYTGAETFGAPYFHAKDFCRNGHTVQPDQNVVVVGGAKSAMDVAYAYVEGGSQVDLVIRPDGNGPVWISQPWVMGGKKRLEKLLSVRWMTWFSPCPWGGTDGSSWIRQLLHGTWLGRWIVDQFWSGLGGEVITTNGYASHPEVQKLQPWNSAFWTGSGLSIHNYNSNFFDLVKSGKIRVHIANIDRLSSRTVHLDDTASTALKADVLVCATGWRKEPSFQFVNFGPAGIGLNETRAEQLRMSTQADAQILTLYPRLRHQPDLRFKPKSDPFRLYRFIVPPSRIADRNIAFAGLVSSVSTAWAANIQGLWISAYLDGRLDIGTPQEVTDEIMLHTQWGKWRYPCGYGASLPDFVFDALPYMDLLMKDLGLNVHRKKGFFKDLTEPYGPEDYRGIVQEWIDAHGKK